MYCASERCKGLGFRVVVQFKFSLVSYRKYTSQPGKSRGSHNFRNVMKTIVCVWIVLLGTPAGPLAAQSVKNKKYDRLLRLMLNNSVPVISVQELKAEKDKALVLDAREPEEYAVSHLSGATPVGYSQLNLLALDKVAKDRPIIVYCSVGYRSQKVTQTLAEKGFTNVKNVYGGIFEWVNQGYPVVNKQGPTDSVHAFSPSWGKWLERGQKVYN